MEGEISGDFFLSNGVIVKCTFSVWLTAASFNAFIGAVRAVLISITLPALRHTHVGAGTLESLGAAGFGLCDIRMEKAALRLLLLLKNGGTLTAVSASGVTYCISGPHRNRRRSRRNRHTPSGRRCSGG